MYYENIVELCAWHAKLPSIPLSHTHTLHYTTLHYTTHTHTTLHTRTLHHTHTYTQYTTHTTCTHTTSHTHTHTHAHYTHTTLHIHTNTLHYIHRNYTTHARMHASMHTHTPLTFNGLSEGNSRVLDLKNWTNDITSAGTIMLVPSEITFSVKKSQQWNSDCFGGGSWPSQYFFMSCYISKVLTEKSQWPQRDP